MGAQLVLCLRLCYQAKERASVSDGKKPFYLKKSEKRKMELVAK